jgi:hypothetical protein
MEIHFPDHEKVFKKIGLSFGNAGHLTELPRFDFSFYLMISKFPFLAGIKTSLSVKFPKLSPSP